MQLTLETPIIELNKQKIGKLSAPMARKLAMAVANVSDKSDLTEATVEDLLNYYPKRYEDRTNFIGIDKLYDGIEATVELYVRVSGGYQVGKNRGPRQPPLFIFEISASDADRRLKTVVVWWFVSGKKAKHIIEY
jgi:RecG-like helicase